MKTKYISRKAAKVLYTKNAKSRSAELFAPFAVFSLRLYVNENFSMRQDKTSLQ